MSGAWPTPEQEQMLLACLAAEPEATRALDRIVSRNGEQVGEGCAQFLPLLYRRWPSRQDAILITGKKAYLTVWRQNQDRMLHLMSLLEGFQEQGIACLVLKGAALILAYYQDPGLRSMRDIDLLVHERDLDAAIAYLIRAGYVAEQGFENSAILKQVRVGHAWQFSLGTEQSCDLHWRPVVRCYSPEVAKLFWEGARDVKPGNVTALVLSPTDQLFHVCAHGLQWDWVPQIRWIADAVTVLREPIDWDRITRLATVSCMRVRLAHALSYLARSFGAPIPASLPGRLERSAPGWERREYRLLLKPCPLGVFDSVAWHAYHFRRIRPFDAGWSRVPVWVGFPQYLQTFLGAESLPELFRKLWPELRMRGKLPFKPRATRSSP